MMEASNLQSQIKKTIHRVDPHAEAYLFGSRARRDNRLNSDWDILILVEDEEVSNEIEDTFRNELYELELESGQVISSLIYPKNYWNQALVHTPIYASVKKEGILI